MKTTCIITKRGAGYIMDASSKSGAKIVGLRVGLTPFDAAARAAKYQIEYGQDNTDGSIVMAPEEVMEHIPEHLRSIAAKTGE